MNGDYKVGDVVLGNWTLIRLIGAGSYGRVFEAERVDFGTTYKAAIKIITIPQNHGEVKRVRAEGMNEGSVTAYFRSFVEEIVGEIVLMSRLKGTANVVGYEDHTVIQHAEGVGWDIIIRMELLTSLLDHADKNPYTRKDIIKLGVDMCKALELCQRFNIIHRDIKPENIFVSDIGDYKLGDFGIARTVEKTTDGLSRKGTFSYMAPEIYRDGTYGPSVDICSLGIVLYQLLNYNRTPFLPDYPAIITHNGREAALAKRISGAKLPTPCNADGRLAEIVLKACAHDPKDRYSSPMQMRQELEVIHYSREEAQIIYPMGDETPVKHIERAESTPKRPEPIRREKTTLIRDYEDDVEATDDISGAGLVAIDKKSADLNWLADFPPVSSDYQDYELEQTETLPKKRTKRKTEHIQSSKKIIFSLLAAALLAVVVGVVGIYSMMQLRDGTVDMHNNGVLPLGDTAQFFQIPYCLQASMYNIVIAPMSEMYGRDYNEAHEDADAAMQEISDIIGRGLYSFDNTIVAQEEKDIYDSICQQLNNDILPRIESIYNYSVANDWEKTFGQVAEYAPAHGELAARFDILKELKLETIMTNKDIDDNAFNTLRIILIAVSLFSCGIVVFFKIKLKKGAISLLILAIIIAGIGGASLYGLTVLNEGRDSLYDNQILPGTTITNITTELQREKASMRRLLFGAYTDDHTLITEAYASIHATRDSVYEQLSTCSDMITNRYGYTDSSWDVELIDMAYDYYQAVCRSIETFYKVVIGGDKPELYGLMNEYDAKLSNTMGCFEELLRVERNAADSTLVQVSTTSEYIALSILLLMATAIAISVVSAIKTIRKRGHLHDKPIQSR